MFKIGTQVDLRSSLDAIKACGLDWEVFKRDILHVREDGSQIPCPKYAGIFRKDTLRNLGIVGHRYSVAQNAEAASLCDEILNEDATLRIIYGHEFFHGDKMVLNLRLGTDILIGPERFHRIIMLAWAHDGGLSVTANFYLQRVATNSILKIDTPEVKTSIKIRHSGEVIDKIAKAKLIMKEAYKFFSNVEQKLEVLSVSPMSKGEFQGLLSKIFPDSETTKGQTRTKNKRDDVFGLYQTGLGSSNIEGTKLGGLISITEYCNTLKSTRVTAGKDSDEVEINGILFGNRTSEINEAFKLLLTSIAI